MMQVCIWEELSRPRWGWGCGVSKGGGRSQRDGVGPKGFSSQ